MEDSFRCYTDFFHCVQHNSESSLKEERWQKKKKRLTAINHGLLLASTLKHVSVQFNETQQRYCHLE